MHLSCSYGDTNKNSTIIENAIEPAAKKAVLALKKKEYTKCLGHAMGIVMCLNAEDADFMGDQEVWCDEKHWKTILKNMKDCLNGLLAASDADVRL